MSITDKGIAEIEQNAQDAEQRQGLVVIMPDTVLGLIDRLRAAEARIALPADDVRDRLVIRHVGGNTLGGTVEQVLSTHLAKGWSVESFEVRPRGAVTEAEGDR